MNPDIFDSGAEALVNPVNCVGAMGKGLALAFKHRYPDCFAAYARACERGEMQPGRIHIVDRAPAEPRFVVHLPTKLHWREPSRLEYVRSGLASVRGWIDASGVGSVAVPALGCGLGGLDWADVEPLIRTALEGAAAKVLVYPPR